MESVEYTIANPVKRLLAYIIDSMFISIASIIILFAIGQGSELTAIVESSGDDIENMLKNLVPIIQILTGIQLALGVLYFGVYQAISNGATLGKKLLHIRIVSIDGSEFSVLNAILRYIVNAISMQLCFLLGLVMFFTSYKQALHDLLVKTTVVDE